ncbi:MAG TPA: transglutaminaseTgpA domain-containing protein [Candidatus Limnocylindria bacterium]|nr:transglutaminaseTgpA domain-containing protein [Candidatus Limnocylindria bacterium]
MPARRGDAPPRARSTDPRLTALTAWLGRTLHALFPPISRRRLRFRGGLFALPIYLLLVLIYPLSLEQAEWVRTSEHLTWLAILGVVAGMLVGNTRMSTRRSVLLAGVLGAIAIVISTAIATEGTILREKLVALAINVNNWLTQVLAGEAATDPTVFILFLGATVWAAAFVGTFALTRTGRPWDALVFVGFCLVVNVSMALTNLLADLVVFTLGSLVLLVRLHIVALQDRWQRYNIVPSGEMDWRLLRGGLTWALVLVIMAFFTPRVGAAEVLNSAYSVFESPYHTVESEWQRFFAGVSGPSRLRGVSFTDSIRLGQSPNLSDRVVMTVDAPSGHFWRAISYDFYTGNGWRSTETERVDKVTPPTLGRERFDATFEIQVPMQGLLFGANEPVKATIPAQFQTGADRTYSTSLRSVRSGDASQRYTVTSFVPVTDKAVLRKAATVYPEYIRQKYLQIPSTLPQRVRELAHKVTAGQPDPYDVAETIESYLRTTYHYAPRVKAPPPGRDPVDYFLFDLKEDFCEYFASSMTLMLREMGVPARVVEGYTTGTLDPVTGKYVVKELDAHAWVEAYFPAYGWIEFEPTPSQAPILRVDSDLASGGTLPGDTGDQSINDPDNPRTQRGESEGLGQQDLDPGADGGAADATFQRFDPAPLIAVLFGLLAIALLAFTRFQMRFRGQAPIDAAWGKARLLASYAGYHPDPTQTTYEYAAMLGDAVPEARSPIRDIAEARVRDRYTAAGASPDDTRKALAAWRRLAKTLLALVPARLVSFVARLSR